MAELLRLRAPENAGAALQRLRSIFPGAEIAVQGDQIILKNFCSEDSIDWSIIYNDKLIWSEKIRNIGDVSCDDVYNNACFDTTIKPPCFYDKHDSMYVNGTDYGRRALLDAYRSDPAGTMVAIIVHTLRDILSEGMGSDFDDYIGDAVYYFSRKNIDENLVSQFNDIDNDAYIENLLIAAEAGKLDSTEHFSISMDGRIVLAGKGIFAVAGVDDAVHDRIIALRPNEVSDETFMRIDALDEYIPSYVHLLDAGVKLHTEPLYGAVTIDIDMAYPSPMFDGIGRRVKAVADKINEAGYRTEVRVVSSGRQISTFVYETKTLWLQYHVYMTRKSNKFFRAWLDSDPCQVETLHSTTLPANIFEVQDNSLRDVRSGIFCEAPASSFGRVKNFNGAFANISEIIKSAKDGDVISTWAFEATMGGDECSVSVALVFDRDINGVRYRSYFEQSPQSGQSLSDIYYYNIDTYYGGLQSFWSAISEKFNGKTVRIKSDRACYIKPLSSKYFYYFVPYIYEDFLKFFDLGSTTITNDDGSVVYVDKGTAYVDRLTEIGVRNPAILVGRGVTTAVFESDANESQAEKFYNLGANIVGAEYLSPEVRAKIWDKLTDDNDDSLIDKFTNGSIDEYTTISGRDWRNSDLLVDLFSSSEPIEAYPTYMPLKDKDKENLDKLGERLNELYREYIVPMQVFGLSVDEPSEYREVVVNLFKQHIDTIIDNAPALFRGETIDITFQDGPYSRVVHIGIDEITAEDAVVSSDRMSISYNQSGVVSYGTYCDDATVSFSKLTEDRSIFLCCPAGQDNQGNNIYDKYKLDGLELTLLDFLYGAQSCEDNFDDYVREEPEDEKPPRVVYQLNKEDDGSITVSYQCFDESDNDVTDQVKTLTLGESMIIRIAEGG